MFALPAMSSIVYSKGIVTGASAMPAKPRARGREWRAAVVARTLPRPDNTACVVTNGEDGACACLPCAMRCRVLVTACFLPPVLPACRV